MTHEEKVKEVENLRKKFLKVFAKLSALSDKPAPRTAKGAIGLAGKTLALALQGRAIIAQMASICATPVPKYPPGTSHPGGQAIVGEVGPELLIRPDGSTYMTFSRIFPRMELPAGAHVYPESLIKEGIFDVTITNAFTCHAKAIIKKVDQPPT